jgi:hypothetical protein
MKRLPLILALMATPALAEAPNLSPAPHGAPGPAAVLVLAQRLYDRALADGDTVMLLTAIRLARGITLRPATGWAKDTRGEALPDQPQGNTAAADPATPEAIALAQSLAGEDPTLQDLVYDLDAQLPPGRVDAAAVTASDLAAGQSDIWQIAFFGESPAEVAVLGDGDSTLDLRVTDAAGNLICADLSASDRVLCDFVPAGNGFFTVTVTNPGAAVNSYRLITN